MGVGGELMGHSETDVGLIDILTFGLPSNMHHLRTVGGNEIVLTEGGLSPSADARGKSWFLRVACLTFDLISMEAEPE
jgi:hypothetical protein